MYLKILNTSVNPIEIRELNINSFRLDLKDLEVKM
jgi:hypothetical protein